MESPFSVKAPRIRRFPLPGRALFLFTDNGIPLFFSAALLSISSSINLQREKLHSLLNIKYSTETKFHSHSHQSLVALLKCKIHLHFLFRDLVCKNFPIRFKCASSQTALQKTFTKVAMDGFRLKGDQLAKFKHDQMCGLL